MGAKAIPGRVKLISSSVFVNLPKAPSVGLLLPGYPSQEIWLSWTLLGSRQGEIKVTPCSHVSKGTVGMLDLGEKSQICGQPCPGRGNRAGEGAKKSPELRELGVFMEKGGSGGTLSLSTIL